MQPRVQLDLALIRQRLFEDVLTRARIARDFGLGTCPQTPEELAQMVVRQLGQTPLPIVQGGMARGGSA